MTRCQMVTFGCKEITCRCRQPFSWPAGPDAQPVQFRPGGIVAVRNQDAAKNGRSGIVKSTTKEGCPISSSRQLLLGNPTRGRPT